MTTFLQTAINTPSLELAANNKTTSIGASPALNATYGITLPPTGGSNGQVLSTDGNGILSWTTPAVNPMTTRGDMIYRDSSNTTERLPLGTNGFTMRSFNSDVVWRDSVTPLNEVRLFDDFQGNVPTTTVPGGESNWLMASTGTAVLSRGNVAFPNLGVFSFSTSATSDCATMFNSYDGGSSSGYFANLGDWYFETAIRVITLSASGNTYDFYVGFISEPNNTTNSLPANAIMFRIERVSSRIQTYTINGGVSTTNIGVAITANTWTTLGFRCYDNGGIRVEFTVNGSLVATHTTNIPTTSANSIFPVLKFFRVIGGAARSADVDYFKSVYYLTSTRH